MARNNVIRMNTLHLNSVRLNGIGEVQSVSLSAGADPPIEPTKAEFAIDSETMTLLAEGGEDDEELSSLSFAIDTDSMSLIMNGGGNTYDFKIDIDGNLIVL